jgi:putative PIN family toxin of toxin-antitoxin system
VKIVLDTNLLTSAVFWGGTPQKVLESAIEGPTVLYASKEIIEEYFRVIRSIGEKRGFNTEEIEAQILQMVRIVEPKRKVTVCRDPFDDMFIDCALAAEAKLIVSGDKDLLTIEKFEAIEIITARQYLNRLKD